MLFDKVITNWSQLCSEWSPMILAAFTLSTTLSLRWFLRCL